VSEPRRAYRTIAHGRCFERGYSGSASMWRLSGDALYVMFNLIVTLLGAVTPSALCPLRANRLCHRAATATTMTCCWTAIWRQVRLHTAVHRVAAPLSGAQPRL